ETKMRTPLFRSCATLLSLALFMPAPTAPVAQSSMNLTPVPTSESNRAGSQASSQNSRLLFVQNNGQFDPHVRFQLRGAGGVWWFTDDGVWLTVLDRPSSPTPSGTDPASRPASRRRGGRGGGADHVWPPSPVGRISNGRGA